MTDPPRRTDPLTRKLALRSVQIFIYYTEIDLISFHKLKIYRNDLGKVVD